MQEQVSHLGDLVARRRLPPFSLPALLDGTPVFQATPESEHAVFRKQGEYYIVTFDGKTVHLAAREGMAYIHALLLNAGREVRALDLIRRFGSRSADSG